MNIYFAFTLFLSSFLLFFIQPLIAKYLLPYFGGGSSVWTIALLLFQCLLLAGYAYAHWISSRANVRLIHSFVIILVIVAQLVISKSWETPIFPPGQLNFSLTTSPELTLLILLALSIGGIYFLLSSTSTLIQVFYSRFFGKSPYWLYRFSNAASLLAIISYPFIFEPYFSLTAQSRIWFACFVVFAVAMTILLFVTRSKNMVIAIVKQKKHKITYSNVAIWVGLSAFGSMALVATTNLINQEISPTPLLWLIPLGIYLLSFVIVFSDSFKLRSRYIIFSLIVVFLSFGFQTFGLSIKTPLLFSSLIYLTTLAILTIVAHQELYSRRPDSDGLTVFYLSLSFGGVLGGGLFVGIIAPTIFTGLWEVQLMFVMGIAILTYTAIKTLPDRFRELSKEYKLPLVIFIVSIVFASIAIYLQNLHSVFLGRNFYGVIRVVINDGQKQIIHGGTIHGYQLLSDPKGDIKVLYYRETSGVGLAINQLEGDAKLGIIGLGSGALMAYCNNLNSLTFYEINPMVLRLASEEFTYLNRCGGPEVILGDARLSMESQSIKNEPLFDFLAIDAFTDDSIPVHLLTNDAFKIYINHIRRDGIIAVHISNRHLDLNIPLKQIAQKNNLEYLNILDSEEEGRGRQISEWVLLSSSKQMLEDIQKSVTYQKIKDISQIKDGRLWTDDYSNLFAILK